MKSYLDIVVNSVLDFDVYLGSGFRNIWEEYCVSGCLVIFLSLNVIQVFFYVFVV